MNVVQLARDMVSAIPSTSGREAMVEAFGRVTPDMSALFSRSYASLVGSGIPSPRPDVALQLSTPHGGHINRMIITSESIAELDFVLHKFRKLLRPANIGAATMKLEQLRRYEQSTPHAHKVLRVASELHKYVDTYSDRLSLTQIANVVRGMSSAQYRLPPALLVRLAAGVVADGCSALRYAADCDVRDVFYGFAGQGFHIPLFWSRLCSAVRPRLEALDPNSLPALVKALEMAQQLPPTLTATAPTPTPPSSEAAETAAAAAAAVEEVSPQVAVARAALRLLASSLDRLQPGRLADTAGLLVTVAPAVDAVQVDEQLVAKLQAASLPFLPSFSPNHLTSLLLGLLYLRQTATTAAATTTSSSAAPAPLPLAPDLLAAAEPHLRAAAPTMRLLHVKRAVQALAPSTAAAADGGQHVTHGSSPALGSLLNLLARRAVLLLPSAGEIAASAPRLLTRGTLAHVPRGGKGAGAVLAAAAPAGDPRVALDTPLLGLLEGLVRAYSCAMGLGGQGAGKALEEAGEGAREARRRLLPDVVALFERVAVVAAAGYQRGLLAEQQRTSLEARLPLLLEDSAVAALRLPAGYGGGSGKAVIAPEGSPLDTRTL